MDENSLAIHDSRYQKSIVQVTERFFAETMLKIFPSSRFLEKFKALLTLQTLFE